MAIYNIKLSNILYDWQLSMASFRFLETYLLHIRPFVVNKSAISPFLGGACISVCRWMHVSVCLHVCMCLSVDGCMSIYYRCL